MAEFEQNVNWNFIFNYVVMLVDTIALIALALYTFGFSMNVVWFLSNWILSLFLLIYYLEQADSGAALLAWMPNDSAPADSDAKK